MEKVNTKKTSSQRVAKSLHAHLVIGLVLGGLIYILALTGTLAVFNREFQRWEQPSVPEMTVISPEAAAKGAKAVFESESNPTTHLYINLPQLDLPRTVITTDTQAFFIDADGDVAEKEFFPWTQFLLDLHYYLHLPHVLGLTVVGALGAFLLVMSITGILGHPRIFRDAFTFRRGAGIVPLVDLHNRLSVWTAPFHISNALTGAILGLATVLAFSIATVRFDGDVNAVFAPIFGDELEIKAEKAPLANLSSPLEYMLDEYPALSTTFLILHDPATKGQHTSVVAKHHDRLIFGDYYSFDAKGQYQGNVGISDGTFGQQLFGSVYNVHFGNWGGGIVKIAYAIFGIVLCIISASGLRIYFLRRQQKGYGSPRLAASWEGVVWGTPVMLSLSLVLGVIGLSGASLIMLFWLGLIALILMSAKLSDAEKASTLLKILTAALLVVTLIVHAMVNKIAGSIGSWGLVSASLFALAAAVLFVAIRQRRVG